MILIPSIHRYSMITHEKFVLPRICVTSYKLEIHVGIGPRAKDRFRWTDRGTYTKGLVNLNGSKLLFFLLLFWKTERSPKNLVNAEATFRRISESLYIRDCHSFLGFRTCNCSVYSGAHRV